MEWESLTHRVSKLIYSQTALQRPFLQEHPLYNDHFVGNEFFAAENSLDTTSKWPRYKNQILSELWENTVKVRKTTKIV